MLVVVLLPGFTIATMVDSVQDPDLAIEDLTYELRELPSPDSGPKWFSIEVGCRVDIYDMQQKPVRQRYTGTCIAPPPGLALCSSDMTMTAVIQLNGNGSSSSSSDEETKEKSSIITTTANHGPLEWELQSLFLGKGDDNNSGYGNMTHVTLTGIAQSVIRGVVNELPWHACNGAVASVAPAAHMPNDMRDPGWMLHATVRVQTPAHGAMSWISAGDGRVTFVNDTLSVARGGSERKFILQHVLSFQYSYLISEPDTIIITSEEFGVNMQLVFKYVGGMQLAWEKINEHLRHVADNESEDVDQARRLLEDEFPPLGEEEEEEEEEAGEGEGEVAWCEKVEELETMVFELRRTLDAHQNTREELTEQLEEEQLLTSELSNEIAWEQENAQELAEQMEELRTEHRQELTLENSVQFQLEEEIRVLELEMRVKDKAVESAKRYRKEHQRLIDRLQSDIQREIETRHKTIQRCMELEAENRTLREQQQQQQQQQQQTMKPNDDNKHGLSVDTRTHCAPSDDNMEISPISSEYVIEQENSLKQERGQRQELQTILYKLSLQRELANIAKIIIDECNVSECEHDDADDSFTMENLERLQKGDTQASGQDQTYMECRSWTPWMKYSESLVLDKEALDNALQELPVESQSTNKPNNKRPTKKSTATSTGFRPVFDRIAEAVACGERALDIVKPTHSLVLGQDVTEWPEIPGDAFSESEEEMAAWPAVPCSSPDQDQDFDFEDDKENSPCNLQKFPKKTLTTGGKDSPLRQIREQCSPSGVLTS